MCCVGGGILLCKSDLSSPLCGAGVLVASVAEAQGQGSCSAGASILVTDLSQTFTGNISRGCHQYFEITPSALNGTLCDYNNPATTR